MTFQSSSFNHSGDFTTVIMSLSFCVSHTYLSPYNLSQSIDVFTSSRERDSGWSLASVPSKRTLDARQSPAIATFRTLAYQCHLVSSTCDDLVTRKEEKEEEERKVKHING